jgi:integrase/recombinase XerD
MKTLPKYLTQDELKRFFAVVDSSRDRALFGVI